MGDRTCDFAANPQWPTRLTVLIFRGGNRALRRRSPALALWRLADLVWTRMVVGAELPFTVDAGPGLRLPHWGRGVILSPEVKIGVGVTLYHRVTLGIGRGGSPSLGDRVYVGTGAVILGGTVVGDRAVVGANAVVTADVRAGLTVVGAPARPLLKRAEDQPLDRV